IDSNESELFFVGQEYRSDSRVSVGLADVRDRASLESAFAGSNVVFHAAALKHVPLCESAPLEAIRTNIAGTQNVIDAARAADVDRLIFTSTDKAVNPTNVMGTSKLMAERLITASNDRSTSKMIAISTRFGNVLGSRGSVLPLFARQIKAGGPVTLTSAEMTRFVMTLEEAVGLVLRSTFLGRGGEVFITKMPIAKIEDLAHCMVQRLADDFGHEAASIEIVELGPRPGEKMYEELMNDEEMRRSLDIGDFIVVEPALQSGGSHQHGDAVDRPYNSAVEPAMSPQDIGDYLEATGLFEQIRTGTV
ncbi:UNVERIFIED_CONTAM: hypothetical protein GTU68_013561, partial [Idotea baltica]|nr:hypothetical protein [Idotea baltica]